MAVGSKSMCEYTRWVGRGGNQKLVLHYFCIEIRRKNMYRYTGLGVGRGLEGIESAAGGAEML